jgi:hypothetical protein
MVGTARRFIHECMPVNPQELNHHFKAIEINSDQFEGGVVTQRHIEIEVKEVQIDKKGGKNIERIGAVRFKLKDLLAIQDSMGASL